MNQEQIKRMETKTPEKRFLRVLEQEFHQAPRVAQSLLEEAQACLFGQAKVMRPGQVRVILTKRNAGHTGSLRETPSKEVIWTVDAGCEDRQVLRRHGRIALRRVRIQRLLSEALEQGAAATQEDLAQVLQVSVRTIKRDCTLLQAGGVCLPTRGNLHGIGRGQTHKALIIRCWLQGETYDQIALHTHHSPESIRRYIQSFVRVIHLHCKGFTMSQIALLLAISQPLVKEYLVVYRDNDATDCRERLASQIERLSQGETTQQSQKGGQ